MYTFSSKCREIRFKILDIFEKGGRGHVPSSFSLVEILVTLYYELFEINPNNFKEFDRNRVLLSKGHGCLALYAILEDLGFIDASEFPKFCKVDGQLGGHPTRGKTPGVEISSGSLGHGLPIAVGKALILKKGKSNKKIVVVLGDGECNEGSNWEAALSANKNKLDNLVIIIDYNKMQSYGYIQDVCPLEPFTKKWESFGLETFEVDMISKPESLLSVLKIKQTRPRVIICHTIKGQGNKILEEDFSWHHKNKVTTAEIQLLKEAMK